MCLKSFLFQSTCWNLISVSLHSFGLGINSYFPFSVSLKSNIEARIPERHITVLVRLISANGDSTTCGFCKRTLWGCENAAKHLWTVRTESKLFWIEARKSSTLCFDLWTTLEKEKTFLKKIDALHSRKRQNGALLSEKHFKCSTRQFVLSCVFFQSAVKPAHTYFLHGWSFELFILVYWGWFVLPVFFC